MLKQIIVEIRFNPTSKFLDSRSEIVEESKRYFNKWAVADINYLEVSDMKRKITGFASTMNAGVNMIEPNVGVFKDTARNFLEKTFGVIEVNENQFTRMGVRSKFLIPYSGSFDDLLKIVKEKFLKIDNQNLPKDFKITDVGFPLDFSVKDRKCHVIFGPVSEKQIKIFLPNNENNDSVGLFIDIDYSKDNFRVAKGKYDVFSVGSFLNEGIEKADTLSKYIKETLSI